MSTHGYTCSCCGQNAKINSPGIDPKGNIWCERCATKDRTGMVFTAVDQLTFEPKGLYLNGCVIMQYNVGKGTRHAWLEGGTRAVPLTHEEHTMDIEQLARRLLKEDEEGKYRCTGCKGTFEKPAAGRRMFAGILCKSCLMMHERRLEAQRKAGHVCRRCRQPFDNCSC